MIGRILKGIAGFYYVHDGKDLYECKARGILRNKGIKPLVGDFAELEEVDFLLKKGTIAEIKERKNFLIRPATANLDQALVVFSSAKPLPNLNLLDKFLVMLETKKIPAALVFTKQDIADESFLSELKKLYSSLYPVLSISIVNGEGMEGLRELLRDKFTVMAGPSGVGKSSLTNYLIPEANMATGEISRKIERGKQTTRHSEIFFAGEGTYLCDTPGFGSMDLFELDKKNLKDKFPEFRSYEKECRFLGCFHLGEKDCAVKRAVECKKIAESRYRNYRLFFEELANKKEY